MHKLIRQWINDWMQGTCSFRHLMFRLPCKPCKIMTALRHGYANSLTLPRLNSLWTSASFMVGQKPNKACQFLKIYTQIHHWREMFFASLRFVNHVCMQSQGEAPMASTGWQHVMSVLNFIHDNMDFIVVAYVKCYWACYMSHPVSCMQNLWKKKMMGGETVWHEWKVHMSVWSIMRRLIFARNVCG